MQQVTITREELYEAVWTQPTMRLAAAYRLSDVGLAKLCRRYDIPRPPRGYWAKLKAGQTPERTPLPTRDGPTKIVFHPAPQKPAHAPGAGREPASDETPPEAESWSPPTCAARTRWRRPFRGGIRCALRAL